MTDEKRPSDGARPGNGNAAPGAKGDDADELLLEQAFAAARREAGADGATPPLSTGFAARLMADARRERRMPEASPGAQWRTPSRPARWRDLMRRALGAHGAPWPAAAGLAGCAAAGLWLGYALPAELDPLTLGLLGDAIASDEAELLSGETLLLAFDLGGLDG